MSKVERDGNTIAADGKTITVTLAQDAQIEDRQLDNFLQYILIGLGIDVKYLEPQGAPPVPEIPAPVEAENVVQTQLGPMVDPQAAV